MGLDEEGEGIGLPLVGVAAVVIVWFLLMERVAVSLCTILRAMCSFSLEVSRGLLGM